MKRANMMLVGCLVSRLSVAATSFPYETQMSVRYETNETVEVVGPVAVPAVGGGMPNSDTIATAYAQVADFEAQASENWDVLVAPFVGRQAALAIQARSTGNVWMGYSNGAWVELSGPAAVEGSWGVKVDVDYTQGDDGNLIRYSVKGDGEDEYVPLVPVGGTTPWLLAGNASSTRISGITMSGEGEASWVRAYSGQRQCYAETATVEDYRMDYSGVTLDVAVGETWGVDTLVATVKDADGNVKGEVRKALSDAQDGKVSLNLSEYTKSGESYTYDLKLTGEYRDTPMTCEKGGAKVDLFSMVNWFGFDGTAPVKASVQDLTISGGVLSSTDPSVKGSLIPNASETESSPTAVEMTLSVPGSVPYWDLPALPVAESQGALVMVQFGGSVGRSWAVWSATANDWVAVSGTGVGTGNGSYEVRAEFDEISSVRSVRYSVKVGSDYVVLKDGQANEWFALPAAATRLNRVSLAGGGGITSLEASYKALGPVPEVSVKDGKIELTSNTELDLAKSSLETDRGYPVQNPSGKKFHLRWKDAKGGDAKWAKVENGQLKAVAGAPANGLESFDSYALGLDPTDELDKPAAVVKAGGLQSATGITVHVPNVVKANLPDAGVEVLFQRQKSVDGGKNWTDDGDPAKIGGELTIPFTQGTLYRVNTVLK
ncbi:MAG: hypothetical protein KBT68_12250 [bacterium]|nr:hypothetical protein [Candidatus Colisoma equi]